MRVSRLSCASLAAVVDDGVFGLVARPGLDVVRPNGSGRPECERDRRHQRDDQRRTHIPAASTTA
jgi:hypothetical protein